MSSALRSGTARHGTRVPWIDVLVSAAAAASWALIGMTGVAALGLRLLDADATARLGPMTAAVVALGAGGSVTTSGEMSAFGLDGAVTHTAVRITPLGVSLTGALLLSYFFLRSLRAAGVVVSPAELLARAGSVAAMFVAMLGVPAWAGHDVVVIDGGSLVPDDLPGGGPEIPGLGDIGDIAGIGGVGDAGGGLSDRVGDLVDARMSVGFTVDTGATLLGGLIWSVGVLLVALLASRRAPLPRGWGAVHRVVRPAASALAAVLLVAVAAGLAAAGYAAAGDDHPRRIAGAALLGAPNGAWLGVPVGLFVPWDGEASGAPSPFLPAPLDDLLTGSDRPVALARLAELDGRVWLLGVGAGLLMLLAGVLTAIRTPGPARPPGDRGLALRGGGGDGGGGAGRGGGLAGLGHGSGERGSGMGERGRGADGVVGPRRRVLGFVGWCVVRLGVVTAVTLPLLVWLTGVSVGASVSVLGVEALGAGVELHGRLGPAALLGAAWGAGAGAAGALLAWVSGSAGRRAAPLALSDVAGAEGEEAEVDYPLYAGPTGRFGPYAPSTPHRPPNPATNPYLRLPGAGGTGADGSATRDAVDPGADDLYGAPTVARPLGPPPRGPRQSPGAGRIRRPPRWGDGPPPPPPPPPPRRPNGGR